MTGESYKGTREESGGLRFVLRPGNDKRVLTYVVVCQAHARQCRLVEEAVGLL